MAQKAPTTQDNVPVAGIKDGVVILKNGQYRMILSVSAINFDLKSEQEQNSIVFNYQGFLNSLHFPIQILISSKKLDLTPYLNKVKKLADVQKNELLKIQTEDYVDFVSQLINLANIMKKSFYVAVGHQPLTVNGGGLFDKLFKKNEQAKQIRVSEEDFTRYSGELGQRASTVAQGLGSIGLHCKQLTTEEIIELLYGTYNPEVAGKERLSGEANNFSSTVVSQSKSEQDFSSMSETAVADSKITIDNTAIVNEQQKKLQQERRLETEKEAEKKAASLPNVPGTAPKEGIPPNESVMAATKTDLNAIQSVPANPKIPSGAPASQNIGGAVTEDVKEPAPLQKQSAASVINPLAKTEVDASVKDPANNKDFGW